MADVSIPTALTVDETVKLRHLARGDKCVLEIGALLGYSTVVLAQEAQVVHSVDPHEGYPEHAPKPTLLPFLDNLTQAGVRKKVVVHVGYDWQVLDVFSPRTFDLVFIDVTGRYEDTLRCMKRAARLLRHYGVMAVHDCGHNEWPGVARAVEECAHRWCSRYAMVDRMAIFQQTWDSCG